jgi:LDH2 family malate/lactate/ureidoglycolate dehydrogenase
LWTASLLLDRVVALGVLGWWPDKRVSAEVLGAQIGAILRAWGMSEEHARITVEHVLYADLRGIDSHGCSMMMHYRRELDAGCLTMTPAVTVVRETETTALVDGGGGLGHVPADLAMKLAIAKCRGAGAGVVAVRNSGHFGAAGAYAAMASAAGVIGMATTSTRRPSVVPTFGAEAKLGTNPIAFAAPGARRPPFLLDMATSTASLGALTVAWRKGHAVPEGWALKRDGAPDTNARRAVLARRLTPLGATREMGSHKGYGLAAMVEILSSALPGSATPAPPAWRADDETAPDAANAGASVGHFFLAIDPQRFRAPGAFEADVDALLESLCATTPVERKQAVLVAGDPERAAYEQRRTGGIPLSRGVVEDLRVLARGAGVRFTL